MIAQPDDLFDFYVWISMSIIYILIPKWPRNIVQQCASTKRIRAPAVSQHCIFHPSTKKTTFALILTTKAVSWFFWRTFVFLCINKITYSFLLPSAWTSKSHRLHHLCMAYVAWVTKPALCYLWILGLYAIAFFKKVKKRWLQQFRN